MIVIMEQTFGILPEEKRKEVLEKGTVKEVPESKIKYIIIEENYGTN